MDRNYLTKEEKEILKHFENDFSNTTEDFVSEQSAAVSTASNFMKKSERINIRLNSYDLTHIKRIAAQEGIPYQTFISSILHKIATGYLKLNSSI